MSILYAYPVAAVSAILSYFCFACLLLPGIGPKARHLFAHPIPLTQTYLLAFDTLRGLAALLVAVAHLWYFAYPITAPIQLDFPWIAYGAKAVPMFAMLSGFLIYRSVKNIDTPEKVRIYLYRRFFRIYPLYFVSVIGMLLIGQTRTVSNDYGIFNYFVAELFMLRVLDAPFFSNPATWSLYVEVIFYLFMPLYIFMVPRSKLLFITVIFAVILTIADQWHVREFYMWKYFIYGIITSELALRRPIHRLFGIAIFVIGVIWLCFDIQGPRYDIFVKLGIIAHNQAEYTVGLGIACGLIMYGIGYAGLAARMLNVFPLKFIGIISYSLFLLHPFYLVANFPPLQFFKPVPTELWRTYPVMPSWYFGFIYVPGVFIWAIVGFLLVERPGLEFGKRWLSRRASAGQPSVNTAPAE